MSCHIGMLLIFSLAASGKSKVCEINFNLHESVHRNNILIYVQQDATLQSLFYLETALHVSGGTSTHHQERKQLYLQHLVFFAPLLLRGRAGTSLSVLWAANVTHSTHV
jgi:hypothetical protein